MDERAEKALKVLNTAGLHARAASVLATFAQSVAKQSGATIELEKDDMKVDARQVMGMLLLCGQQGSTINVVVRGPGAFEIMTRLEQLFFSGFGEGTSSSHQTNNLHQTGPSAKKKD